MNAMIRIALGMAVAASLSGCAMASGGNGGASGSLYSGYKMGGNVGAGTGTKTGEACVASILGIIATGDASLAAAKAAGGITQVSHVDHDIFSVLGLYAKSCTIVVGQ